MPTSSGPAGQPSEVQGNESGVPQLMVQQAAAAAAAAAASEHDRRSDTAQERRHMGHDVPMQQQADAEAEAEAHAHAHAPMHREQTEQVVPPPAYGERYGEVHSEQEGFGTNASVDDTGRVNIRIDQKDRRLSGFFVPALRQQEAAVHDELALPPAYVPPSLGGGGGVPPPPPMNVVIHVVGSRGDVQPFIALGKVLRDTYSHRVRLATHPVFKEFVQENGLEFFSIGGDPAQLMAFMVKNPGLMPGFDTLRKGDVGKRRREVAEYIKGCWRSCYEAGDGLGAEATDDSIQDWTNQPSSADESNKPFVADCIIANPPSFAHVHCAEKMGIPLHIMFTMPYSPTQAFPHPLANIQSSNADPHLTNYISYALIDMLTWQGLGDIINRFRQKSLGLEPISLMRAPGMLQRLKIPHTYCWSPALIPKPKDWGQQISISGFFFLNLALNYTPAPDLKDFLDAGPPPVYIGFGSIVLDDPDGMTKLIFDAVRKSGQRAFVSKGWGGFGADQIEGGIPDGVFMLGNVPHDWLFKHVSCVVHHGGAGTTAAGITAGKPTVVVPFFGDQPFWGAMVARAGAGPDPIPHKQLTADKLAEAIEFCLKRESQDKAHELAASIATERGSDEGAQSFHQNLNVDQLRCNLSPSRTAVWRLKRTQVRLSAMAACTLANENLLDFNELKLLRSREYETDEGPWDPISGGATALVGTMSTIMMGVADFPVDTLKALHIHPDAQKRKKDSSEGASGTQSPQSESGSGRQSEDTSSAQPARSTSEAMTSQSSTPATSRTNSTFNFQESLAKIPSPPPSFQKDGRKDMPGSMADALRGQLASRSRSRSGSRPRSRSGSRSRGNGQQRDNPLNTALQTGQGLRKIAGAAFSSPMDFTMSLTKGFHNAPKLYGDETVRKPDQVTDFKSGLKAASKEFGYGMYDGITGLVTQPMKGAAKEGPAGFVKGIGKGIGGIALKPGAAIFGIPGYTMKGVYKEMQKMFGSSVQNYTIAARTAQGFDEWQATTPEERADVVRRWKVLQKGLKKKKNPDEMVRNILEEQKLKKQEQLLRMRKGLAEKHESLAEWRERRASRSRAASQSVLEANELEEAIKLSVQETSRGNRDEDAGIERAIQASLAELQHERASRQQDNEEADMQQAMEYSVADAHAHGHPDVVRDVELERVITQSLHEQRVQRGGGEDDKNDEELQQALRASQAISTHDREGAPPAYEEDPEVSIPGHLRLSGTTREAFEGSGGEGEKSQQEKSDEEVVMEYVRKQSLLEERLRRSKEGDEEDQELRRAMRESLTGDEGLGEESGNR
ncbi:UDP-Glycosyltransferase/glycogen phosphorylase [Teratosphaeria nubilosa]|uniref:UDP-Glycosyltransferase/glycogen phosphorylase n=1 Tax=Teratosphaeria nubilosa TaxID=161662 RepID=A0A6G1L7N4_9PEZI|nr:UDP-Glycosyltransferase/glycogen phosphorylase [Teratosphaeria nubilosa]